MMRAIEEVVGVGAADGDAAVVGAVDEMVREGGGRLAL